MAKYNVVDYERRIQEAMADYQAQAYEEMEDGALFPSRPPHRVISTWINILEEAMRDAGVVVTNGLIHKFNLSLYGFSYQYLEDGSKPRVLDQDGKEFEIRDDLMAGYKPKPMGMSILHARHIIESYWSLQIDRGEQQCPDGFLFACPRDHDYFMGVNWHTGQPCKKKRSSCVKKTDREYQVLVGTIDSFKVVGTFSFCDDAFSEVVQQNMRLARR